MKIVIPEVMDAGAVEWLAARYDVVYDQDLVGRHDELLALLGDAAAVIVKDRTQVDRDMLGRAPALRAVGRLGVGLDNIDQPACRERGIAVFPAVGANARSVAEYVVCTALMMMRPGAYQCTREVAAGQWPQKQVRAGRELDGKVLGIAGLGAIGRLVARLGNVLGMQVLAWAPTKAPDDPVFAEVGATRVEMDELLARADVLTLHVPLNDQTRGLIDASRLAAMKPGAVLINTARGGVVDDAALVAALREGRLGGAAVDVYTSEPLPAGSVYAEPVPNLILTPHIGGGTVESTFRRGTVVAERVAAHLEQIGRG